MSFVSGTEILHVWVLGSTGRAGFLGDTLTRYPGDGTEVAASETVTVAEVGSTGTYEVTYTPTLGQVYKLRLRDSGTFKETWWEDAVASAPATTIDGDSYCGIADVESRTHGVTGVYSSTSKPSDAIVRSFMKNRASAIYARLSSILGDGAPAPGNYPDTVEIDTTTDRGTALAAYARDLNCIGAAADALSAGGAGESPGQSDRVAQLLSMWEEGLASLKDVTETYSTWAGEARVYTTEGGETAKDLVVTLPKLRF